MPCPLVASPRTDERSAPPVLAATRSRDLVALRPQRPRHDWEIVQADQALACSRALVTRVATGACCGCTRDGQRAKPERGRRERGRGSTRCSRGGQAKRSDWRPCSRVCSRRQSNAVGDRGCDGLGRKRARNTSTCAVQLAPWPLPDWVEQASPNGRTRAPRRSLKKTEINRKEDASKTQIGRKRMAKKTHVHTARKEADSRCRSHRDHVQHRPRCRNSA